MQGIDVRFIGRAGEHRVVSELLLKGHNPSIAVIDQGVDIILENGTTIQVKTTSQTGYKSRENSISIDISSTAYTRSRSTPKEKVQDLIVALNEAISNKTMKASEVNKWLAENNLEDVISKIKNEDGEYSVEDIVRHISEQPRKEFQSEVVTSMKLDESASTEDDIVKDEVDGDAKEEKDSSNAPETPKVTNEDNDNEDNDNEISSDDDEYDDDDEVNENMHPLIGAHVNTANGMGTIVGLSEGGNFKWMSDEDYGSAGEEAAIEITKEDITQLLSYRLGDEDDNSAAVGKIVIVPRDLTTDPINKQGESGEVIVIAENGDVTVKFADNQEGTYTGGVFESNEKKYNEVHRLLHLMKLRDSANYLFTMHGLRDIEQIEESLGEELTDAELYIVFEDIFKAHNIDIEEELKDDVNRTEYLRESLGKKLL